MSEAWELERNWANCEAKLEAVKEWYIKTRFRRGQLPDDAWIALHKILEDIPEDDVVIPIIIRRKSEVKTQ